MKRLVQILLSFFLVTQICFAQWMTTESDSLIQQVVSQTNLDSLTHYLRILTGVDSVTIEGNRYLITTRHATYPGNNLAADFIYQTLSQTGLPTFNDNYSSTGRNVYSVQTGTDFPDQKFIICAHYDDMPQSPIAPGADDNASGVAAVLEAARVISQIQTKYTIIYALWDEEEVGLIGSANYANHAYTSGEDILGVINLDMIGWDSNDDNAFDLHSRSVGNSFDLARLGSAIADYFPISANPLILTSGATSSDHASFWSKGYNAIMIAEESVYDFNPYYHTSNDNINHFKFTYFLNLSKLSIGTIMFLGINGLKQGNLNSSISSLDKTYARLGEDSVLFKIAFPNFDSNQNFVANLICGTFLGQVIDSLTLFDDGLHQDSLSDDGIFGVCIPPRSTDDFFITQVSTFDQSTNKYHNVTQWVLFTTVGPVSVDSVFIRQGTPNNYSVTVTLKNNSASKTIEYTQAKLNCSDLWVNSISPPIRDIGDILPNGTKTVYFTITSLDSLPHLLIDLEIEIFSYGFSFWKYLKQYSVTGIDEEHSIPLSYNLEQNFPNPFNPSTTIRYSITEPGKVKLTLYNLLGEAVATLVNEEKPTGNYSIEFNAANLPSGVYFYQLRAGDYTLVKKMILLK